jgi:glycosyltransferase involved in cell wall biosynthesis
LAEAKPATEQPRTVISVFGVKPFRIGGTETFARELSRQLNERGWKSVLCFQEDPTDEVRRFLDLPNVSFETLPNSTNFNWGALKALAKVIRKYQAEILHLHFTGFLGAYPWLARLLKVKRIFFTDHSSRPAGYVARRAPVWKRAAARVINLPLSKVVCVSEYGKKCLTALDLLPRERHELILNAVDLARVKAQPNVAAELRRRYQIPEDRVVIVQVSWMIPEKGIPELLKTARALISGNSGVHFVLVGEGAYREQFMKDAEAMGLASHITWTGLIKDPFGEGVFEMADIVCQLSDWEELFGWMIAEAMAHGKPIVATKVGGIPELVEDGVSGFLVSRGNSSRAAARLDVLARDPALRESQGKAGRERVSRNFDLKQNVAQLIRIYEA